MNYFLLRTHKVAICIVAILSILLMSCDSTLLQSTSEVAEPERVAQPTIETTATPIFQGVTPVMETPVVEIPTFTPIPSPTTSVLPTATATALPTPINTSTPLPVATAVPCQNNGSLPPKGLPGQVNMSGSRNQRVAIAYPFLYLAAEEYIGIFDISDPAAPQFWGFWHFPEWPNISTLQVDNGVAYFTSGSTLVILNLASQCQFELVATSTLPFQAFRLQLEGDRLYVGGDLVEAEKNQVVIFSITNPNQPEELGLVDLGQEPATWSVFEKTLYVLSNSLFVINVSDPANPQPLPVNLALDPKILAYSPSEFVGAKLYLLWEGRWLTIIEGINSEEPARQSNPDQQILMGDLANFVYQVSENYIFLGTSPCDVNCVSVVDLFNTTDATSVLTFSTSDHLPIHSYYEITPTLIYAFTDDSLLVIDISDHSNPIIIWEVPLIT